MPLGIPHCSGSDLQPSSEEVAPSENARNALMDVDEKYAIYFATKALSGKDVPTPKKRK